VVLTRKDGVYRFRNLEDSEMEGLYHVGFHWIMEGETLEWKVRGCWHVSGDLLLNMRVP
jgi:hypothetical protein